MKIKAEKLNILLLAVFLTANFLVPSNSIAHDEEEILDSSFLKEVGGVIPTGGDLIENLDPEIQRLKDEIQNYQSQLDDLTKQRQAYETSIKAKRQEINNLHNQIDIMDDNVAKLELEIQSTGLQIEKTNLEIENVQLEIDLKQREMVEQKNKMSGVIQSIDKMDRQKSHLEVLILKGDLGSFFKEINELQLLETGLNEDLEIIVKLKNQLDERKDLMEKRKEQLNSLKDKLSATTEKLKNDQLAKSQLLVATQGQETNFQKMLAEVQAEQNAINSEIQNLEIAARKRLLENEGQLPNDDGFIWPVPSRRVTAYFHDPSYPFRYVFEHPAIDIGSTPQGTPIRAAGSGYVARVKYDGSKNYAYILLVHDGGLSTVYGHISKPYVSEDDFVVQGEVIALSGGAPGSAGAGALTTGAHLHLEVRLNGIPVDPLKYLP